MTLPSAKCRVLDYKNGVGMRAQSVRRCLLVVLFLIVALLYDYESTFLDSGDDRFSELDFQGTSL
jgi:hypothetical protein